ncbi:MAG: c-type cytochrome, partial [bacterium]|nr:c-type cytochrome [bacterium]
MRNRVRKGPRYMMIAQSCLLIAGLLVFSPVVSDRDQAAAVEPNAAYVFPEDASRGWRLFLSKNCIHCHAIWGQGQGTIGPDLGRIQISHQSQG